MPVCPSSRSFHPALEAYLRSFGRKEPLDLALPHPSPDNSFIDQDFARFHNFPLHQLKYPRRLSGFDGQPALTGNITHIAEVTMDLNGHVEKLFLYVTGLRHYPIVLGHPWLRRHGVITNFSNITLSLSSPFCLAHCCPSPVMVQSATTKEEEFLMPAESQKV